MISFKKFISENPGADKDQNGIYSPQQVSTEEFISWCEKYAPGYLKNISSASNSKIFRGFKNISAHSTGKIDTDKMNRMSANTFNYYTLWMDNSPAWSAFPKRSKSLICSTSISAAGDYARNSAAQLIIPADSNKIGICSDDDLWFSFHVLDEMAADSISDSYKFSMDKFMTVLYYGLSGLGISENEVHAAQTNYSAFESIIKRATRRSIEKIIDSLDDADFGERKYKNLEKLLAILEKNDLNSLYDLFVKGLDPESNKFRVTTASKFRQAEDDTEIWVQGPCYTIDTAYIENACTDSSNKIMYDFLNKYNLCALRD